MHLGVVSLSSTPRAFERSLELRILCVLEISEDYTRSGRLIIEVKRLCGRFQRFSGHFSLEVLRVFVEVGRIDVLLVIPLGVLAHHCVNMRGHFFTLILELTYSSVLDFL